MLLISRFCRHEFPDAAPTPVTFCPLVPYTFSNTLYRFGQDALNLKQEPMNQLLPHTQQLVDNFSRLGGDSVIESKSRLGRSDGAAAFQPNLNQTCSVFLEDGPRSEHLYDQMVEEMTFRAWKFAWEAYTARSAAANRAAARISRS